MSQAWHLWSMEFLSCALNIWNMSLTLSALRGFCLKIHGQPGGDAVIYRKALSAAVFKILTLSQLYRILSCKLL